VQHLVYCIYTQLQNNNLDSIPAELGCLAKLTCLNLCYNRLRTLPATFFKLRELRTLQLAHNQLEDITDDVGDLVMLENLVRVIHLLLSFFLQNNAIFCSRFCACLDSP
jgi:Leucine-rich repeat (LRR) protein